MCVFKVIYSFKACLWVKEGFFSDSIELGVVAASG